MTPKDISAEELIKKLTKLGYKVVRQKGSHIRIQTLQMGQHSETIPNHKPIKLGTLRNILKNVSNHFGITLEELEEILF